MPQKIRPKIRIFKRSLFMLQLHPLCLSGDPLLMPKSNCVAAYPELYFQLFEQVAAGKPYTSPSMHWKRAATIRLDMYGFQRALMHEEHPQSRLFKSFKILIPTKAQGEGPLRIVGEERDDLQLLASTAEPVKYTDEVLEDSYDEDLEGDAAADSLNNLGFSSTPKGKPE